jgi:hypothetical protein
LFKAPFAASLALLLWIVSVQAEDLRKGNPLNTLEDVRVALQRCYQPTAVSDGQQVTVRFAFRGDGHLLGVPRVTYVGGASNATIRLILADAARRAIADCAPLALTKSLAGAIAGRVFTMRFIGRRALPLS